MSSPTDAPDRWSGVGSSDVAAILNCSPWGTPWTAALRMLGLWRPKPSEEMEWGQRIEAAIAEGYAARHGVQIWAEGTRFRDGWMRATVDRLAAPPSATDDAYVLECKAAGDAEGWGQEGTDEVPRHYLLQVQWQMAVVDLDRADLAVLVRGQRLRTYTVQRCDALIDRMTAVAADFLAQVRSGELPLPDWSHPKTAEVVRDLFHPEPLSECDLAGEAVGWAERYRELTAEASRLDDERQRLKAQLIHHLGERGAEAGRMPDGSTVKAVRRRRKGYEVAPSEYLDFRVSPRRKGRS